MNTFIVKLNRTGKKKKVSNNEVIFVSVKGGYKWGATRLNSIITKLSVLERCWLYSREPYLCKSIRTPPLYFDDSRRPSQTQHCRSREYLRKMKGWYCGEILCTLPRDVHVYVLVVFSLTQLFLLVKQLPLNDQLSRVWTKLFS